MADEYIITIRAEASAQDADKIPVAIPSNGGVQVPSASKPASETGATSAALGKMVVTGALIPIATTIASTSLSNISIKTGNNKLQQKIENVKTVAGMAQSVGAAALAGFAVGGIPGTVVGAMIGAVGQAANIGTTMARSSIEYQNEQIKLGVSRERAGIMTNRRRS